MATMPINRLGRFDPRLARSYHCHRDTAQLRLRCQGQLAKISFNHHARPKRGNPAGVTYLKARLVINPDKGFLQR